MENNQQSIDRFKDMMADSHTCMFITNDNQSNYVNGRPMAINKVDDQGAIWFFSKKSSHKIDEIIQDREVSLAVVNDAKSTYLMVHGTSELIEDKDKIKELWNPLMKAWFTDGVDDPDLIIIKVKPHEANYWDSSSSKMVQLVGMIKAMVTGEEYHPGSEGKLKL